MPVDPVEVLKEKVLNFLPKVVESYEVRQNSYVVRQGSTAVFVEPRAWTDGKTVLRFAVPVLHDVPDSEALYKKFSELNGHWLFGRIYKQEAMVFIDHVLLGDYLDAAEFETALVALALTADKLDEELRTEFGGKRFTDA